MEDHIKREILDKGLGNIKESPKDNGTLDKIVVRPESQKRINLTTVEVSSKLGVHGDRWIHESWKTLPNGESDPLVQVAITNSRSIDLVSGHRDRWDLLGDNLYLDFDLSEKNLSIGEFISIGSVILEISSEPNYGCAKFLKHYGKDALKFINTSEGKQLRLRGIFARVVKDGTVTIGDTVTKHQFLP
jgi:hypothetical protein